MILVTLGTQKQQFTRLLEALEKCDIDDKSLFRLDILNLKVLKWKYLISFLTMKWLN